MFHEFSLKFFSLRNADTYHVKTVLWVQLCSYFHLTFTKKKLTYPWSGYLKCLSKLETLMYNNTTLIYSVKPNKHLRCFSHLVSDFVDATWKRTSPLPPDKDTLQRRTCDLYKIPKTFSWKVHQCLFVCVTLFHSHNTEKQTNHC